MSVFDEDLRGKFYGRFWGRSTGEKLALTAIWAAAAGLDRLLGTSNAFTGNTVIVGAALTIAGCNLIGAATGAVKDTYHSLTEPVNDRKDRTSVLGL